MNYPTNLQELKQYFFSLIGSGEGKPAGDWASTLNEPRVIDALSKVGIGMQRRGAAPFLPSSRLYLPTSSCPSAAPRNQEEISRFGVNQDKVCWQSFVDTVDNSTQTWKWEIGGSREYLPVFVPHIDLPDIGPLNPNDPDQTPAPIYNDINPELKSLLEQIIKNQEKEIETLEKFRVELIKSVNDFTKQLPLILSASGGLGSIFKRK